MSDPRNPGDTGMECVELVHGYLRRPDIARPAWASARIIGDSSPSRHPRGFVSSRRSRAK